MAAIDFVAAEPTSYDHSTGGGAYDDRTINTDVVESLEPEDFVFGDLVTFFVAINADDFPNAIDWNDVDGAVTLDLELEWLADATGQSGAGFIDIVNVQVNSGVIADGQGEGAGGTDSGHTDTGETSTATLTNEVLTDPFDGGTLGGTIRVTGINEGDHIIVRIDVLLEDDDDPETNPTGNLQASFIEANYLFMNNEGGEETGKIPGGKQTIPVALPDDADVENPSMAIVKTVIDVDGDGDGTSAVDEAGDVITYQIQLFNTGDVALTNITLADSIIDAGDLTFVGGDTNNNTELDTDEVWTYTGTYTVTQDDIDNNGGGDGDIDNVATADSDETDPVSDDEEVPIDRDPGLSVTKTAIDVDGDGTGAGPADEAGDIITYQIVTSNTGNVTLTNVTIVDPLTSLNVNIGDLGVGESDTRTATYTVTQSDLDNNGIDANGSADGDGDVDNIVTADSDETDPVSDDEEVPLSTGPGLSVTKTAIDVDGDGTGNGPADEAGDIITYQIVTSNTGNVTLTDVTIEDPLTSLNVNIGDLGVGESDTRTATYTVTQSDLDNNGIDADGSPDGDGDVDNIVTAGSNETDPVSDDEEVPLSTNPGLAIDKMVVDVDGGGPDGMADEDGDIITYAIKVTNTGNVELTDVVIQDPLTGLDVNIGDLAPGDMHTETTTYTVTLSDLGSTTIDFEDFAAGTVIDDEYFASHGLTITGLGNTGGDPAMIFDTDNPTGFDLDLGMASQQDHILIISEDGDSGDPDDDGRGGSLTFTFEDPVSIFSLTMIDTEEGGGSINLFDGDNVFIGSIAIPVTGDGGTATVDINTANVGTMQINLRGSGGVDDLVLCSGGEITNTAYADSNETEQVMDTETVLTTCTLPEDDKHCDCFCYDSYDMV